MNSNHHSSPDFWHIDPGYHDAFGHWHETSRETREAILTAMGDRPEPANPNSRDALRFMYPDAPAHLEEPATLRIESGESIAVSDTLPAGLPMGYHDLLFDDGTTTRLIVAPHQCYLPPDFRTWGWTVQLYSMRSRKSWGIGDLADLRQFTDWSARELGAGVVMINPLSASTLTFPQEASPYCASSRRYRSLLYLRIEEIPGASAMLPQLEKIAAAGRSLNVNRRIDRDEVLKLKLQALEVIWARFQGSPDFDLFCAREGADLESNGAFQILCQHFGRGWHDWPAEYRTPNSEGTKRILTESRDRVRFFMWIEWLIDCQFAAASKALAIIQDLPIGVDKEGADAWLWQDYLAQGISVGAPPDPFNANGQDWGLPPFIPYKIREAGYEPFIRTIRALLRNAGGIRLDHVMGLFRLFWIPEGGKPVEGAYIRYNAEEFLRILALESHRAKAFIIGEDLGTVEPGVRETLADRLILSYRLAYFEEGSPADYPNLSLAAVTTHDLPTIAGVWTGADIEDQKQLGVEPNYEGVAYLKRRVEQLTGLGEGAEEQDVITTAYKAMDNAASRIVTATLEDALGVKERPNMPAIVNDTNWSRALPIFAEDIPSTKLIYEVAASIGHDRGAKTDIPTTAASLTENL